MIFNGGVKDIVAPVVHRIRVSELLTSVRVTIDIFVSIVVLLLPSCADGMSLNAILLLLAARLFGLRNKHAIEVAGIGLVFLLLQEWILLGGGRGLFLHREVQVLLLVVRWKMGTDFASIQVHVATFILKATHGFYGCWIIASNRSVIGLLMEFLGGFQVPGTKMSRLSGSRRLHYRHLVVQAALEFIIVKLIG